MHYEGVIEGDPRLEAELNANIQVTEAERALRRPDLSEEERLEWRRTLWSVGKKLRLFSTFRKLVKEISATST